MPIQEQNIKFLASQVMDDVPEGGGAATGNEIPDGVMNNVFEDISDLDRAMGRFNLRKLFLAVRTLSTDLFGGAKTVVTALPEDPAIGYTLFTTDDPFDTRDQAANRVEAYLFKGPMWAGGLYENHIQGMRQIRIIQRPDTAVPPRGKTLCLVSNEGLSNETEQYVRVTEVSAEIQMFYDADTGKDFPALIVTADLSDGLRHDFDGHTPNRAFSYSYNTGKARLRDTTVADATRYYGAQYLTAAASIGDRQLRAASMFTQLVPAAQTEDPLANQSLNPELVQTVDAGARDVEVVQQAHTIARQVTAENRRLNWIETLSPVPAPGAFSVSYMSQGNWITLTDDGAGAVSGSDPGFGTGTMDYVTGNSTLTTGALPDVGSQIIYTYGSRVHYEQRAGANSLAPTTVTLRFTTENTPVAPETLTATWAAGGVTKTATSNSSGTFSGDATGEIDPITGEGYLVMDQLPDRGADLSLAYDYNKATNVGEDLKKDETVTMGTTITLSNPPNAGGLRLYFSLLDGVGNSIPVVAKTSGGNVVVPKQQPQGALARQYVIDTEQIIGTISGTTITLTNTDIDVKLNKWLGASWGAAGA